MKAVTIGEDGYTIDDVLTHDAHCQSNFLHQQLAMMVTHDVDEAIYMGTRVIAMEANPGQIKADIPIELPYPRDRSSAEFVGYRNQILGLLNYGSGEKGE